MPETYQEEQARLRREIRALAVKAANHLPGWTVRMEREGAHADFVDEVGRKFGVGFVWNDHARVTIGSSWGSLASFIPSDVERPGITVAAKRGGAALAREIQLRFLPAFIPLWDEAAARQARHRAAFDRTTAQAQELVEASGARLRVESESSRSDHIAVSFYSVGGFEPFSVRGRVHDGRVELDISGLPVELAKEILALVASQATGRQE